MYIANIISMSRWVMLRTQLFLQFWLQLVINKM